jgi:DNA invertase Pin-like site-specific DNA recombinase
MTRRALAYARQSKSNADDGADSVSIAAQRQRITDYAARNDLTVVDDTYQDVDVRGTTVRRVGLDAMLARIDQGGIDAVIVYDVSRLSRDTELFINLLNRLKRHGVELISTREPAGEEWLQVLFSSLAQRDRGLLSVRVADAMRERAQTGQFVGQVPLGYTRVEHHEAGGRIVRRLEPNALAPTIREMFARYDRGESVIGVARWLNQPGHPRPKRAARWSGPTVNWMLRNPAYAGDVIVKATTKYPAVTVRDAHPAIVSRDLFDRVQRRLDEAGNRDAPRLRKTGRHWLEGRVWCACGAPMYLFERHHTVKGHLMRTWGCRRANATHALTGTAGDCDRERSTVGNRRIEPIVRRQFAADLARMAAKLPDDLPALADRPDTMRDQLARRLADVRAQRRNLATAIARAVDPTNMIDLDNALAEEERSLVDHLAATPPLMTIERLRMAVEASSAIAGLFALATLTNDHQRLYDAANRVGLRVIVDGEDYAVRLAYGEPWGRLV